MRLPRFSPYFASLVYSSTMNLAIFLPAMMDGIQLCWLRSPGQNLNTMWADCEDVLMPLPLWEGYR